MLQVGLLTVLNAAVNAHLSPLTNLDVHLIYGSLNPLSHTANGISNAPLDRDRTCANARDGLKNPALLDFSI